MQDQDTSTLSAAKPRDSIQRKLVLWTLLLILTPTFAAAFWLNVIARNALADSQVRGVESLTQMIASSLSGRLADGWSDSAAAVVNGVAMDPRVGMILVTDARDRVLHRRVLDPQTEAAVASRALDLSPLGYELEAPILLDDGDYLVARKSPIWSPVVRHADRYSRNLEGFVTLALHDRQMPFLIGQLQMAQVSATVIVCSVMLPVVVWTVWRWTAPLKALLKATAELADGVKPQPIDATGNDELGLLARAFNAMAGRLHDARTDLQRANEQLEQKVQQRTAELQTVNEKLQREIDDKNAFLRAVSHDLGAPVRNISGMTAMLLMKYAGELTEDALTKLERISANAKLQAQMISELLDLSRIRTQPGRKESVDLNELLGELRSGLEYDLEQANIELCIADELPIVYAERNRMRQVFQNLMDNAIKYMLDSPVRQISIEADEDEQEYRFRVADTGCGIAAEDHERIFQVFTRAGRGGELGIDGRGVGLASVKSIVEMYGGRIWVESASGQGATFHFTFAKDATREPSTDERVAASIDESSAAIAAA